MTYIKYYKSTKAKRIALAKIKAGTELASSDLEGLLDWVVLSRYINTRKRQKLPVDRGTVCIITRAISAAESEQEISQLIKAAK